MSEPGDTSEPAALRPEAEAYASELRKVLAPGMEGRRHYEVAKGTYVDASTLSRYLSGKRTAPAKFIQDAVTFLGLQLDPVVLEALADLRRAAEQSSLQPSTHARYWIGEAQRLTEEHADCGTKLQASAEQLDEVAAKLADLEKDFDRVLEEGAEAQAQREAAEKERDTGRETIAKQKSKLSHAQRYVRQIENELVEQQELVRTLRKDIEVLRRQVRRLHDEPAPPERQSAPDSAALVAAARATHRADTKASAPGSPPHRGSVGPASRHRSEERLLPVRGSGVRQRIYTTIGPDRGVAGRIVWALATLLVPGNILATMGAWWYAGKTDQGFPPPHGVGDTALVIGLSLVSIVLMMPALWMTTSPAKELDQRVMSVLTLSLVTMAAEMYSAFFGWSPHGQWIAHTVGLL
jgi:ribosomal protein S6